MQIKNRVGELVYKKIDELNKFQGNLKTLSKVDYEKLKSSFVTNGMIAPIFIWQDKILDGHQRLATLQEMVKSGGVEMPESIPCVQIHADNEKQAKKFILQFVSQQGDVSDDGMYEFIMENGIDFFDLKQEIKIPNIDLDYFEKSYFKDGVFIEEEEKPPGAEKEKNKCPKCGHEW